jgi:hypothetical protein
MIVIVINTIAIVLSNWSCMQVASTAYRQGSEPVYDRPCNITEHRRTLTILTEKPLKSCRL